MTRLTFEVVLLSAICLLDGGNLQLEVVSLFIVDVTQLHSHPPITVDNGQGSMFRRFVGLDEGHERKEASVLALYSRVVMWASPSHTSSSQGVMCIRR